LKVGIFPLNPTWVKSQPPDEQVEKNHKFYFELVGFIPPRIQADPVRWNGIGSA
jgi:hypothetical protein